MLMARGTLMFVLDIIKVTFLSYLPTSKARIFRRKAVSRLVRAFPWQKQYHCPRIKRYLHKHLSLRRNGKRIVCSLIDS